MGAHHPRHAAPTTRRLRYAALAVIGPLAVVTLGGMAWLWPTGTAASDQPSPLEQIEGVVTAVAREPCPAPPADEQGAPPSGTLEVNGCGRAVVAITDGSEGEGEVRTDLPNGAGAAGDRRGR